MPERSTDLKSHDGAMSRVLILCEYPTLFGGEMSMLATLDSLQTAGYRPTVAAPRQGALANELLARQVATVEFEVFDNKGNRRSRETLRHQLDTLIDQVRPDVVHANSLAMGRLAGPVVRNRRLPSIAHLRDILRLNRAALDDLNCHARLLAVSHAVRDFHVAAGLDAQRIHVLYNGVDLQAFCPRPATGYLHRELGIPPESPLIAMIGQISLRKAQDIFLMAAQQVATRQPEVHFLVVGARYSQKDESIEFEEQLRAASATASLAGHVHFLGIRDDIARLLGELTVLAHPARQEPLGRVLLEAAAAGIPVVATRVGGTEEIFARVDGRATAQLTVPDDPQAFASAIEELLARPGLREQIGRSARRRMENTFDARTAGQALVAHYKNTTDGWLRGQ